MIIGILVLMAWARRGRAPQLPPTRPPCVRPLRTSPATPGFAAKILQPREVGAPQASRSGVPVQRYSPASLLYRNSGSWCGYSGLGTDRAAQATWPTETHDEPTGSC